VIDEDDTGIEGRHHHGILSVGTNVRDMLLKATRGVLAKVLLDKSFDKLRDDLVHFVRERERGRLPLCGDRLDKVFNDDEGMMPRELSRACAVRL
jgi:hypothetical protein